MNALNEQVTILLVEDDEGDAKMVKRAFKQAGLTNPLRRAINGEEALDILRGANAAEKLQTPYLVLSDINMPRMTGLSLVRSIRDDPALSATVVFMLTTSSRHEDIEAAYGLNVAGYILKDTVGYDYKQLIDMLTAYSRIVELPA